MEALIIPDTSEDWKLNRNVDCRITLNKLKIKTPEYETMELCRTLTNTTKDMGFDFKSEFILDVLLNDILRKCDKKCGLCEEYVHQLRHHITQAHTARPYAQTVFKCDVCSSIFSSPSMLIRHRNTHSDNSDTLTTPCTNESERVRFDSNNIYASIDISSRKTESVSSGQCEDHPLQPVPVPPMNVEWNCVKQEDLSSSQSELEISNPSPLGILQHMNHLSTIENNLKQECVDFECEEDLHDPLLLQDLDMDLQVPSFDKSESTGISTESEQHAVLTIQEKSSKDMSADRKSFPVPLDLTRHKISNIGQKSHKCDTCGKCFRTLHHLTQHKSTHTGEKPHKCDVCGKCFTRSSGLTGHRVTHTGEKSFRCDECGKDFSLKSYLAKHKLVHSGEKSHSCVVCGKCFAYKPALLRHKRTHTRTNREKIFHCDVCGSGFALKQSLAVHKLKHTGEKPHTCDICGQSFYRNSELTRHKLVHTGEKPFECSVCGKCFFTRPNLTQHELTHTGEKPYKCDVCGKNYRHNYYLKRHKIIHTGEKSFRCDVCSQSFYRDFELTKHKLKHAWHSTTSTLVNNLKEERESEEEGCQEDPLLNLELSS